MTNVGFIGVGYMGYGMVKNLLKKHNVFIFAHKNRKPINKLVKLGAIELKSYKELKNNNLNCLMFCVTNTPIALKVANEIKNLINKKTIIIDLTTHDKKLDNNFAEDALDTSPKLKTDLQKELRYFLHFKKLLFLPP